MQPRTRRRAVVAAAAAGALAYVAHRDAWLSRLRASLAPLSDAASAYAAALKSSGEAAAAVSRDVARFLADESEAPEVPPSLRALLRLAACDEAAAATAALGRALAAGAVEGCASSPAAAALAARLLAAAATREGRGLLTLLAAAAARAAVTAALDSQRLHPPAPAADGAAAQPDPVDRVLTELDTARGRRVAAGAFESYRVSALSPLHCFFLTLYPSHRNQIS